MYLGAHTKERRAPEQVAELLAAVWLRAIYRD
jgi:hypothetical protein